jgi:hypothetical protein
MSDKDNKLIFEGYQQISEVRRLGAGQSRKQLGSGSSGKYTGRARKPGSYEPPTKDAEIVDKKEKPPVDYEKIAGNIRNTAGKIGRGVRYATDLFSRDPEKSGWAALAKGARDAADWAKGDKKDTNNKVLDTIEKIKEKIRKGQGLSTEEFITLFRYEVHEELNDKGQKEITELLNTFGKQHITLQKYNRENKITDETYNVMDVLNKKQIQYDYKNIQSGPEILNFSDPEHPQFKFAVKVKDIVSRNYFYKPLTSIEHLVQFIGDGLLEYMKKGYNIKKAKEVLSNQYDPNIYNFVMNNYLPDILRRL